MAEEYETPQGWQSLRLGLVAEFEAGKREKGGAKNTGEVFSIGGEHITEQGTIDLLSSPKYIPREFYDSLRQGKVRAGDSLIVKDGARTGKSVYIGNVPETGLAVNEHVFIVRPQHHALTALDSQFLGFWLRSMFCLKQIERAYHGLIGGINREDISSFSIQLPPLPEQKLIARVLLSVQQAKEACERVIAATRQLKQSLLHFLFTYGPVPFDQADKVPLKETEIGAVPQHWEIAMVKEHLREPLRNGHSARPSNSATGIRILTLTAVTQNDFSEKNTKLTVADPGRVRNLWIKRGDIFVERANTPEYVGLAALYEGPDDFAVFPDLLIRVRMLTERINPKFLAEFLRQPYCRRYLQMSAKKTAGNFPKIDQGVIENTHFPLPPMSEQAEIAAQLSAVDAKLTSEEARRDALSNLFQSLLHHLMTGKVRVTV
jgi:type I restriction enzyme S subunit